MNNENKPAQAARREFIGKLGIAATYAGTVAGATALGVLPDAAAKSEAAAASFPTEDYDWTKHQWGFGVDATKCIGCLRCVEACKRENHVAGDAHHFRTWVERYV